MSLRDYIYKKNQQTEVEDIYSVVDADIALSAQVYKHRCSSTQKLMWFHNVDGTTCSVVSNLFSTTAEIEKLLSCDGCLLSQRISALPANIHTWDDLCAYIRAEYAVLPIQSRDVDPTYNSLKSLYKLPQVRYWAGDSRAYFSLATTFSRAWEAEEINAGIYRLSVVGPRTLIVNWRPGSRAHTAWQGYATRLEKMPVTIALGVDPRLTFASLFPLPASGSELSFWGFMRAQRQQVCMNDAGLPIPSGAEVLLQGYVEPLQLRHEGSYANHTGYYTDSIPCPVIQIQEMQMRPDAIVPITVVGPPPTESSVLGSHVWKLLAVLLRRECPFILELVCPQETSHLPVLIIQVSTPKNTQEWELWREVILNHPILSRSHTLILIEESTAIANFSHLYWHCMNQGISCFSSPRPDLRVVDGVGWLFNGRRKVVIPF